MASVFDKDIQRSDKVMAKIRRRREEIGQILVSMIRRNFSSTRIDPQTPLDPLLVISASGEGLVHSEEALTQQEAQVAANVSEAGVEVVDNVLFGDKGRMIFCLNRPKIDCHGLNLRFCLVMCKILLVYVHATKSLLIVNFVDLYLLSKIMSSRCEVEGQSHRVRLALLRCLGEG